MKKNSRRWVIPLLFLFMSFINIHFALLAFVCFFFPFYTLFKTKSAKYCQKDCPRAHMLLKTRKWGINLKIPKLIKDGTIRKFFLWYFFFTLSFVIISTLMVALTPASALAEVRFFFIFPVPFFPQLVSWGPIDWLLHLSYRLYSMIFTTVVIGLMMSFLYKPRTWCVVCPITSINQMYIKK